MRAAIDAFGRSAISSPPMRIGKESREAGALAMIPTIGSERKARRTRGVVASWAATETRKSSVNFLTLRDFTFMAVLKNGMNVTIPATARNER